MTVSTNANTEFFDQVKGLLGDSNMLVGQYFDWLERQGEAAVETLDARIVRGRMPETTPFLSVICRTQGKRIEELRQALASLQAQTCRDFQLILVGHETDGAAESRIGACLDEFEGWLQDQTLFVQVNGGTRTRPLNAAMSFVAGDYFAVFDEDDLVYENWVSSFASLAKRNPGHVLYCFVETQYWRVDEDAQGGRALVPESDIIGTNYCKHPNDLLLLAGNYCPFMGLAFPSALVHRWGLRFNERLQTTEDWDFFMRARNVYPFASSDEHVALYRLWSAKGGNSSSSVDEERWNRDHAEIQAAKAATPLLFAPGFSDQARQALGDATSDGGYRAKHMSVVFDVGDGFDSRYRATPVPVAGEADAYAFDDLKRFGPVQGLFIEPALYCPFAMGEYSLEIRLADGAVFTLDASETQVNGRQVGGQYEFPTELPRVTCMLPQPETLDRLVFRYRRSFGFVPPEEKRSIPARAVGKLRSLVGRLRG